MEAVCSSGGGINIFTKCSFQNDEHIYGNTDCSLPISEKEKAGIFLADVDCSAFRNDAVNQLVEQLCYTTKSNKVTNVKLGQFYYYTSITAPSSNFIIDVVQKKSNEGLELFAINQKNQIVLWDATCKKVATGVEVKVGLGRINILNAKKGAQYVLSAKYNCKSIVGSSFNEKPPVCTYKFSTKINDKIVDGSKATIDLVPNCESTKKVAELHPNLIDVEVYPLPFKDKLSLKYNFETTSEVKIEIFDVSGRLLSTQIDNDIYRNKELAIKVDFAKQSNQLYLIRITSDNGTIFKRVFSK